MYRFFTLAAVVLLAISPVSVCRAGDVIVQKNGSDLLIASVDPGSDDTIIVAYENIWRSHIRITNLNGTIWGRPEAIVVASRTQDLRVELGDGNDTLELQSNIRFRHVSIDVGADQHSDRDEDTVEATLNYTGTFTIDTGPDLDKVTLEGVHCDRYASGFKYLSINTGDGPDIVDINNSFYLAPFVFLTTYAHGNAVEPSVDRVTVDTIRADNMWVNSGGGDDILALRDIDAAMVSVNAGDGGDDVAFSYCSIGSLNARLYAGNDKLLLFEVDVDTSSAHGGDGTDRLNRYGFSVNPGGTLTKTGWEYYNGRPTFIKIPATTGVFTFSRMR